MANYLDNIGLGLLIKKPNIVLPWSAAKNEILSLDREFQRVNDEDYYMLRVELENLPFINNIGLHFNNNRLAKLALFYVHENDDQQLKDNFLKRQDILDRNFGKAKKALSVEKIFTQVNKGDIELKWQFKNITIIHRLWDRFGLEEILEIKIK